MTAGVGVNSKAFRRAVAISAAAHTILLAVIIANPSLPKPAKKGMTIYIPLGFVGLPGGGGGGGSRGGQTLPEKAEVKKQTLRDLTTADKVKEQPKSSLRYPTDKPKKDIKPKQDKKAAISKPDASAKAAPAKEVGSEAAGEQGQGTGGGTGLTIGGAGGPGFGEGSGWPGQAGLANFPFQYYLQAVRDKISSKWFTSLVDPGVAGALQVAVYFRIYRNGTISAVEVRNSSEVNVFDMAARRAVMDAAPFPPLPSEYREEYLGIFLVFEHTK
jgi:TonB family protein